MNYTQTLYKLPLYIATAAVLTGAAGCATKGSVQRLEDQVSQLAGKIPPIQKSVENIGTKVEALEQKPYAERPLMVKKGQGVDELYGWLRGQILPQYKDPAARKEAEDGGNALVLIPTGLKDRYYAVVVKDADNDGLPSKGDYKFVDIVDGKQQVVQFAVQKKNLPEDVRWQLLNVIGAKPFSPPVQPKQESKPLIRRQPMYIRPQVGYRGKG